MANVIGRRQLDALAIAAAPAAILAGVVLHPYQGRFTDSAETARLMASAPTRWAWAHLALGFGICLLILAVFALRHHLRSLGEDASSFWAVPFTTIGGGLFVFIVGAEGLGGFAAAKAGEGASFADALQDWWWLWLMAVALLAAGLVFLATAVARSGLVVGNARRLAVVGLVAMSVAGFIPAGVALYVTGASSAVALGVLAGGVLGSRK